jgi:hypothetical protein
MHGHLENENSKKLGVGLLDSVRGCQDVELDATILVVPVFLLP